LNASHGKSSSHRRSKWREAQDAVSQGEENDRSHARGGADAGARVDTTPFRETKRVAKREKGRELGSAREADTPVFRGKNFSVTAGQLEQLRRDYPKAFKGYDSPEALLRKADADIGIYITNKRADDWDKLVSIIGRYQQWAVQDATRTGEEEPWYVTARRTGKIPYTGL